MRRKRCRICRRSLPSGHRVLCGRAACARRRAGATRQRCRICRRGLPKGAGRPRVVCARYECERALERLRWNDTRRAAAREVADWWLALDETQRRQAAVWMRDQTPPKAYLSKHDWAYRNRATIFVSMLSSQLQRPGAGT